MDWLGRFSRDGFTVLAASRRDEAKKVLRKHAEIGAVLLDPNAVKLTPMEVIDLVEAEGDRPRPELHLFVDEADVEQRLEWLAAGADSIITKRTPYELITARLNCSLARSGRYQEAHMLWRQAASSQIADTDTGMLNQRYLDRRLEEEVGRSNRESRPLSLMLIELNSVEEIRREFGNEAAHKALLQLSERVGDTLRVYDVLCRVPPSRLAVILPAVDPLSAYSLAKRLLDVLQNEPLAVRRKRDTVYRPVQAAIGLAGMIGEETDMEPRIIVKAADRAVQDAVDEKGEVIGFVSIRDMAAMDDDVTQLTNSDRFLRSHNLPRRGETLEDFPMADLTRIRHARDYDFP